jgi:hypothetical protein
MQTSFENPATIEARAIMRLVSLGTTTVEDARDLIAIPDRQERALKKFVAVSGKTGAPIGYALVFRQRVAAEFERLLEETARQVV